MTRRELPPVPAPPANLSAGSRELWPGLAADVVAACGGAAVDFSLLVSLLRATERLEQVRSILDQEGLTATGSKGQVRPHPLVEVESALRREIALGYERLLLAPSRRVWRMGVSAGGRLLPG